MPAVDVALVELGKLLGVFKPGGELDWAWFGDPLAHGLSTMPTERASIGAIVRALLDRTDPAAEFDVGHDWEPFLDTNGVGLGLTWTKPVDPLRIALGAKADLMLGGKKISLGVLAGLVQVAAGNATPELGRVGLRGTYPVPDFLSAGTISADLDPVGLTLGLGAANTAGDERVLEHPNPVLAWDTVRLAVFVLRAWVAQQAAGGGSFFSRIDEHLWPMLGDPAGPIQPFPVVGAMKSPPAFDLWRGSVLSLDGGAAGALTFLWHLRALLTGNESPNFLEGSLFFPLTGAPGNGSTPTPADVTGPYVSPTGSDGAAIGLLTEPAGTFTLVLDLETAAPARTCRIPLARSSAAGLERPPLDASWTGLVSAIAAGGGLTIGTETITAAVDGAGFRLSLLRETVAGSGLEGFDGAYDLAVRLEPGQGAEILLVTPALTLVLPPDAGQPEALLGDVVAWALRAAAPGTDLGGLVRAAADLLQTRLAGGDPDEPALLAAVVGVAGQGKEISVPLGDGASLDLAIAAGGRLALGIGFGPVDDPHLPVSVGRLKGSLVLDPAAADPVSGFGLTFENLQLGDSETGDGIIASLIPDLRELPGFRLAVDYAVGIGATVTGGGKIPVQRTLGPLQIAALLVEIRKESMAVGLDLGLELGPITVSAYELGLTFRFSGTPAVEPFLHGLGLAMDAGPIKLGGFFGAVTSGPPGDQVTDYVGGATVSVAGFFELSAIGGYTQVDGEASLFIFASLVAPLGGPPFFFVTGIAGGFGFNRALPDPGLMMDHPFLKVMRGEIDVSGAAADVLKELSSKHFVVQRGQHWIAAGISFTAFGFINGKVVIAIGFGHSFSFTLLGMASFAIPPICYVEIGIMVTADADHFLLRARLSPNSYLLHPDLFSMQGDIALGAWYAAPHTGDFLFSIGGYHPLFAKPEHYPELLRVGGKATLYAFVHLSVEVFFCCTPQALMAGARASLWAEVAGISAGLDVYVDVLMTWDPFYLIARLGVCVWFEFFGRHEISVDLQVWTPDFGGIATIDLTLVEFEIEFGAHKTPPPPPPLTDFLAKQVGLPATPYNATVGARVAAFSTQAGKGLFRIEFLTGRVGREPSTDEQEKQQGLDPGDPVLMSAEWSFALRTMLPLSGTDVAKPPPTAVHGEVDLPLCADFNRPSVLDLGAPALGGATRSWLTDFFPAATFGPTPVPEAQAHGSARDSVAAIDTSAAAVALAEGMVVDCSVVLSAPSPLTATAAEPSDPDESYPLPLGAEPAGLGLGPVTEYATFGLASTLKVDLVVVGPTRRAQALTAIRQRVRSPFTVEMRSADLQRVKKVSAGRTFTVRDAQIRSTEPPLSPARPAELFGLALRVLPLRSNEVRTRGQLETVSAAPDLRHEVLTPPGGVLEPFGHALVVETGRATVIDLGGGAVTAADIRLTGDQHVRTVVLDRGGEVVVDAYASGESSVELPLGTATGVSKVILVGEGRAPHPTSLGQALGVERDSTLLAVGRRTFLGQGCVIEVRSAFDLPVEALDSLPGAELLDRATTLDLTFHTPRSRIVRRQDAAVVITVVPTLERPGPAAEQVRWLARGATFGTFVPVVAVGRVAFVLSVRAPEQWVLSLDLGPDWRLAGVAYVPRSPASVVEALRTGPDWDLIDDAMPPLEAREARRTEVKMEVAG